MKRRAALLSVVAQVVGFCGSCFLDGCGGGAPPPVATQLAVIASSASSTAGTPFTVSVKATDASGTLVSSYSGTVHFASSDPQAVLPNDSPLTSGAGSFRVTCKTAGNQTVTVSDSTKGLTPGTLNSISVSSAAATHFSVSGPSAATVSFPITAGVTALDDFANVVTSYAGMVRLTSSDAQAVLPPSSALTGGTGSFSVTPKTVGSQTITATDTVTNSITGVTSVINVVTNAATQISVTGPTSSLTRQTVQLTLTAVDAANNVSVGYSGTLHFTSSDAQAMLPPDFTLAAGTATVSATLETAGAQTITATDTGKASLTGSAPVSVTAAADLVITSGNPPSGTVGARYNPHSVRVCVQGVCKWITVYGFALNATGGISTYGWSWAPAAGSSLPPGLNVTTCAVTVQPFHIFHCISGIPTRPGAYNVVLTVKDSGNPPVQTSTNYTITIDNPPPPAVNTTPVPLPRVVNQPYSFPFTASGYPPLTWSESGALPTGLTLDSNTGMLSGTPTQTGSFPITVTAMDQFNQSSVPANFTILITPHGFVPTGSMGTGRSWQTATLLCNLSSGSCANSKVLVAGGIDASFGPVATAEIHDPGTGKFSPTGSMKTARAHFAATLLNDGRVLVTGGLDSSGNVLQTAELYNPNTGTFSFSNGNMQFVHASHTATLLNTGKVLIAGWGNGTAELFDPATGTFTPTGSMVQPRTSHTATLLESGKVLLAGGVQGVSPNITVLAEAELYDPNTGTFSKTAGNLTTARQLHAASLLNDGKVLVMGGLDAAGSAIATAEMFDPTSQSFTQTTGGMSSARVFHTSTTLADGTVLVIGGSDGTTPLATTEIYDPKAQTFSPTGSMNAARASHTATLLKSGSVLVTGGVDTTGAPPLATAEVYQ